MMKTTAMLALALASTTPLLPAAAQTPSAPPASQGQAPQAQAAQPGPAPQAQTGTSAAQPGTSAAQPTHRHRDHRNASQASAKSLVQHVDDRIAMMHRRLGITAQQEPAWNAFAQVMRDNANTAEQAYRDRAAHLQTMNALDNLRAFAQLEQSRAQGLQNLTNAFEPLYASFNEQQKQTADAIFRRDNERMARHRHGADRPSTAAKTDGQK